MISQHQHHLGCRWKRKQSTPPQTYQVSKSGDWAGSLFFNEPYLGDSDAHSRLRITVPWRFGWKPSEGCVNAPKLMQVCVYVCSTHLLEEVEPQFSLGSLIWHQQCKQHHWNTRTQPCCHRSAPWFNIWKFFTWGSTIWSQGVFICLSQFLSTFGLELHVGASFLHPESQWKQLFYDKNFWLECLRAKDHVNAATQRSASTTSLK